MSAEQFVRDVLVDLFERYDCIEVRDGAVVVEKLGIVTSAGKLERWLSAPGPAFVLISHDRAFLTRLTTATLWLDRGVVRRQDQGFAAFEAWRDKAKR